MAERFLSLRHFFLQETISLCSQAIQLSNRHTVVPQDIEDRGSVKHDVGQD